MRMNAALLKKLKELKEKYQSEGFEIVGLFGSFARNQETSDSDIDLLYKISERFVEKNMGFFALARLETIREELENELGKEVDLSAENNLSRTGQRYILSELIHV